MVADKVDSRGIPTRVAPVASSAAKPERSRRRGRGQSVVELALIIPVVLMVLMVGIQFAIIGAAALGLAQVNYQGVRYAAINPSYSQSQVQSYMLSAASPFIAANSGSYFSSTLSPTPPCPYGNTVTVTVTFNASHLIVLPNPFLGISFPTSLNNSASALCE